MHRKSFMAGVVLLALVIAGGCGGRGSSEQRTAELGYVVAKYNFSIDGNYDPRIAGIIPEYTALTVAVANKGFYKLHMKADEDKWKVKDRDGNWHDAILDIQYEEPEAWQRLSPKARQLILYPKLVPSGYTQTFQIFFPGRHNLAGFQEIRYKNAAIGETFTFTRY